MSLRVIAAHLDGSHADQHILDTALALAEAFGGHIDATCALPNPTLNVPATGRGLFPGVVKDLAKQAEVRWQEQADKIAHGFHKWRAAHGVPEMVKPSASGIATAAWREASKSEALAKASSLADILVSALPVERAPATETLDHELSLFQEGRPVLFMPKGKPARVVDGVILIAWNGSPQAFHAITAALPILKKAKAVHVCSVPEKAITADAAAELVRYLDWHGVKAKIVAPTKGKSAAVALEAAVKQTKADLLVMGAYTHSRLREWVLGGVTQHYISDAKIPVLMAH